MSFFIGGDKMANGSNTIESQIQILDDIEALDRILSGIDNLISKLEKLDNIANGTFGKFNNIPDISLPEMPETPELPEQSISIVQENIISEPIPDVQTPEPVKTPVEWDTPTDVPTPETAVVPIEWNIPNDIDIFDTTGVERYKQEMTSLDNQMEQLMNNQTHIDSLADNMDIIPDNMINDINILNQRIFSLGNTIQSIERNKIDNVGADRLNNQIEALRGHLNDALESQNDLNNAIKDMDATRAQKEYQRLNGVISNAQRSIRDNINAQNQFNETVRDGENAAEGLINKISGLVKAFLGIQAIKKTAGFINENLEFADVQIQAETKLETIMKQRMQATENMIQSVKDLASAQQEIGVIGDEVQLAGAAQVSTFLTSTKALKSLMPAMNNLAVAQKGVNVTSEDMYNLGNMVGKVMQGQTAALTRAGITFNDAEEEMIKYGNEADRAATLAKVINRNVGEMNAAIANTPQGQLVQMSNAWGDMKEEIGMALYPAVLELFKAINENMPAIKELFTMLGQALVPIIYFLGTIVTIIGEVYDYISENWSTVGPIIEGIAIAVASLAIAIAAVKTILGLVTVAQWLFNTSLYGCPIIWLVLGMAAIIAAIIWLVNELGGLRACWELVKMAFQVGLIGLQIAWNSTVAGIVYAIDSLKIAMIWAKNKVLNAWDLMSLGISTACVAIQNFIGDMKAGSLQLLQDMINGAIGLINDFISKINSLGIVEFGLIEKVSFGTEAAVANEAEKAARNAELQSKRDKINADMAARDAELDNAIADRERTWNEYMAKNEALSNEMSSVIDAGMAAYETAKQEHKAEKSAEEILKDVGLGGALDNGNGDIANKDDKSKKNIDKVGKVDKVGGTVDVSSEDLKRMRDIYENDIVQEVYVSQITPQVNVTFGDVKETADVDKMLRIIKTKMKESINISPEGVH